jgi:hypothetical protein
MARFETGANGNPHYHGFSMGRRGPRMNRVRADVEGVGDEPPDVDAEICDILEHVFGNDDVSQAGIHKSLILERLRKCLPAVVLLLSAMRSGDLECELKSQVSSSCSDSDEEKALERLGRREMAQADNVLEQLVAAGYVELLRSGSGEEAALVESMYGKVPSVPQLSPEAVVTERKKLGKRLKPQQRVDRAFAPEEELNIFKNCKSDVRLQSTLEKEFESVFGILVSEWNPCYADDGMGCRYTWDDEIGAHDVEVEIETGENEVAPMTSEERAIRDVPARWPERLRLRALLDDVFGSSSQEAVDIDLQRVRRLVSALVNRTGRTIHPKGKPKLGVHPCARGKEPNPFCRYGFPHPCVQRGGERPMRLERGEKEAQWFARFARNDELCCNYEAHVLLANMGNVDWRPCLNLWAVVQYVTKYATKAPKGSRRLHDLLKDAVDEVCTYLPEGEGNDFLRRSIQKFFARTMGERDFHAFEAVQLGLQLPLVMPLMPVVSLNTSGSRPLKSWSVLQSAGPNEPVHYDSRVDKFNKRLQFVRRQCTGEELKQWEGEIRDVSLFEFYWKYCFYRG